MTPEGARRPVGSTEGNILPHAPDRPLAAPRLVALARAGGLALAFALTLAGIQPAAAQTGEAGDGESGWSILEYDEDGRAIGVQRGKGGGLDGDGGEENGAAPGEDGAREKAVEPNELLIAGAPADAAEKLRALGFTLLERERLEGLSLRMMRVRPPDRMSLPEALERLRSAMPEATIDTNDLLDLSDGPRAQRAQGPADYARETVGWGPVPESCGAGLRIGQIDGAVATDHPALRDRDVVYDSFIKKGRRPAAEAHGTAIAVMLVGKPRAGRSGGLLPGARLYAANIFERRAGREKGNLAALLRAISWMAENEVQVTNLSVAGAPNALMRLAVNRARELGLVMVAAAGNKGPAAGAAWPAADEATVAVTAIDRSLRLYRYANRGDYVDFAAPGVGVLTETPYGLREQSGTSIAAPFITAIVAVHLKAGFPPDPKKLRQSMKRFARDLGEPGRDAGYGWGLVRLKARCD